MSNQILSAKFVNPSMFYTRIDVFVSMDLLRVKEFVVNVTTHSAKSI